MPYKLPGKLIYSRGNKKDVFRVFWERDMSHSTPPSRFEEVIMPHLAAAYSLARWMTRNPEDAQDIVQEASLRAFRFFSGYHGGNAKAWLLSIVRNTGYTWLRQNRAHDIDTVIDDETFEVAEHAPDPEARLAQSAHQELIRKAMEKIPLEFREIIILRDLEGFSYKEIVEMTGLPMGTVMSRLSRARNRLQKEVMDKAGKEFEREL
jgi:RNA polymerase sigma factor (sigma-70 family)